MISYKQPLIAGTISAFLYVSGLGSLLFLLPLEWAIRAYGKESSFYALPTFAIVFTITRILQQVAIRSLGIELLIIAMIVGGLYVMHLTLPYFMHRWRALYRLLACTALFALVTLPVMHAQIQNPELLIRLRSEISNILANQVNLYVNETELYNLIVSALRLATATYTACYFLIIVSSWWTMGILQQNSPKIFKHKSGQAFITDAFSIPKRSIWILILLLALLIAQLNNKTQILFYFVSNALVLMGILFFIQGISLVIKFFKVRYKSKIVYKYFPIILLGTFIIPFINAIIISTVLMVGISKSWIDYDRLLDKISNRKS